MNVAFPALVLLLVVLLAMLLKRLLGLGKGR